MTDEKTETLFLASLRAKMGDWIYYITFMKMEDLSQRIKTFESFYSSPRLRELLQRQVLPGRAKEISHYLKTQKQRFFNALVIGTYGGNPKWNELTIEPTADDIPQIPQSLEGTMGFLVLDGSEKLFAIDGQHRVKGIQRAVEENPELASEEVCVILVRAITAENREEDEKGYERTRRLFTTLNRYAKPVSKKDSIALDEDDSIAIITRQLLEGYPLFSETKISIKAATSIPAKDKQSLTSINALYDALNIYFIDRSNSAWKKFKRFHPGEPKITEFYEKAVELWDIYCKHFPSLKELKESDPEDEVAGKYRHADGGNLLFRPIGLLLSVKVIRHLMDHNELSLEEAVNRISNVPMDLSEDPWAHLLWNPLNKKMITAALNRRAAEKLFFNAVGGDLTDLKSSTGELREELAAIKKIDDPKLITLPSYEE